MSTNYVAPGEQITVVAPHAVTRGNIVVVGVNMFGVAKDNAVSAANVVLATGGIWTFNKPNAVSTSAVAGGYAYWDNTNSQVTISATSNTKIGVFTAAVTNTQTTANVRLNSSF